MAKKFAKKFRKQKVLILFIIYLFFRNSDNNDDTYQTSGVSKNIFTLF